MRSRAKADLGGILVGTLGTTGEEVVKEEVRAAGEVGIFVTTREEDVGGEVQISQEEVQRVVIEDRTTLVVGRKTLVVGETPIRVEGVIEGASRSPQHSSSALFCVFCGEECRDDLAGCHGS